MQNAKTSICFLFEFLKLFIFSITEEIKVYNYPFKINYIDLILF